MEALIETAFKEGGMALAFIVMLWAYRELWTRRYDELSKMTAEKDADRKVLLDTLEANTRVKQELMTTLETMQSESQASRAQMEVKTAQLLQAVQAVDKTFATHRGIMEGELKRKAQ